MNVAMFSVIVILLIICISLLIMLIRKNLEVKKQKVLEDEFKVEVSTDIADIRFPHNIEEMSQHTLFQACERVFESFKLLEYANKNEKILNNYEWHSWQISLLLSLIQRDQLFYIPNPKLIFHEAILNKSLNKIKNEFDNILIKYQENVNISRSRDDLSNDLIWSVSEVSIIFYYMLHRKNFEN